MAASLVYLMVRSDFCPCPLLRSLLEFKTIQSCLLIDWLSVWGSSLGGIINPCCMLLCKMMCFLCPPLQMRCQTSQERGSVASTNCRLDKNLSDQGMVVQWYRVRSQHWIGSSLARWKVFLCFNQSGPNWVLASAFYLLFHSWNSPDSKRALLSAFWGGFT